MNPGPELDRLIAEKVFNWQGIQKRFYSEGYHYVGVPPDQPGGFQYVLTVPPYSGKIEAAWKVVEKLRASWNIKQSSNASGWYFGLFKETKVYHFGQAETAPHAICLAALAACGVTLE